MDARASEVFVGRERELAELERALAATQAGSGASVLVTGEAGIGKTRLASEFARRARDAGFAILLGRSIPLVGTDLPYQPFVEALRPLGPPWLLHGQSAGSQLRVFEETLAAAHASAPHRCPCCSCSKICIGRTPRRSISLSSSHTISMTDGFCCSRHTARMSTRGPSAYTDSPKPSDARARRSCSRSGGSRTRS